MTDSGYSPAGALLRSEGTGGRHFLCFFFALRIALRNQCHWQMRTPLEKMPRARVASGFKSEA